MTANNQYKKLNILFLVIIAPFPDLTRQRDKLSAVLPVGENNQAAGKTYVYEYDSRGNILSRKTYDYTIGEVGTIRDTDVYLYSGDRLMSYDGSMNFQYDAIGNPTLYFNSTSSRSPSIEKIYAGYRYQYFSKEHGIRVWLTID